MFNQEKQNFIKRNIERRVARHLLEKEMTIILGPRQVGKTVLLGQLRNWLLKKKISGTEDIFYFNLDIVKDWELVRDQTQFIEFLKSRIKKRKIFVFIDEAQRVENPGLFYKGVYDSDLNAKFVLTGSASLYFASQVKESLAGRKRIFFLYPFSFTEYLLTKDKVLADLLIKGKDSSVFDKKELQNYFQEYLIWGGYPRVVLSKNPEDKKAILADIYSSYIERDIIGFLKITDKAKFNKIVKLLAGQTGQLVNIGELASISELDRRTVSRHLTALEETYVISQLIPYYNNPRQEIIKNPKVYFLDNGLRNYLLDDFKPFLDRPDSGALFESSVLQELLLIQGEQLWSLRFWRTKQGSEVDFVIEQGKRLVPLEVKVSLKSPQVSPGLRSFIKKYQPQQAFMVNFGFQGKTELEKTKINFLPPFYLNKFLK